MAYDGLHMMVTMSNKHSWRKKLLPMVTIVIEEGMKCSCIDGPVGRYHHHRAVQLVTI